MKNRILILPLALLGLGLAACSPEPSISHSSIQDGTDSTQASSSQQSTSSSSSTGSQPSSDSSSSTEPDRLTFTIYFHSNGGTEIEPETVFEGDLATEPEDPILDGFTFDAWYEDKALTKPFDFLTPIHSDWHLYAGYTEEGASVVDPEPFTLYFRDASWWSADGAKAFAKLGSEGEDYGVEMENLRFCNDEYQGVGYNYYKVDIPDVNATPTLTIYRMGLTEGLLSYWGAYTATIDLTERGEHNLYDIKSTEATWDGPVEGVWGDYDPNDLGNPDAPEPPINTDEVYLKGSFNGWSEDDSYKLEGDPETKGIYSISDVYMPEGSTFKVHDVTNSIWAGYSLITADSPVKEELTSDADGNAVTIMEGTYDIIYGRGEGGAYLTISGDLREPVTYSLVVGDDSRPMRKTSEQASIEQTLLLQGDEFTISSSEGNSYGYADLSAAIEQIEEGEGGAIKALQEGYYTISLSFDAMEIGVEYVGAEKATTDIYFSSPNWWNQAGAATYVQLDSEPKQKMAELRFCPTVSTVEGYKYWSISIDDIDQYSTITFLRCSASGEDWGARTGAISLDERGENDLYDCSLANEAWYGDGNLTVGSWAAYDPNDRGNVDAPEPIRETYLIGSGSWIGEGDEFTIASGIKMEANTATEVKLLGLALEAGDEFAISDLGTTYGFSALKSNELVGTALKEGADGQVVVEEEGTYDFYFDFNSANSGAKSLWVARI